MTMDMERAMNHIGRATAQLTDECNSPEDALVVSTALRVAADMIDRTVGGADLVAKINYAAADRAAEQVAVCKTGRTQL